MSITAAERKAILKEIKELDNQVKLVTAERDALKTDIAKEKRNVILRNLKITISKLRKDSSKEIKTTLHNLGATIDEADLVLAEVPEEVKVRVIKTSTKNVRNENKTLFLDVLGKRLTWTYFAYNALCKYIDSVNNKSIDDIIVNAAERQLKFLYSKKNFSPNLKGDPIQLPNGTFLVQPKTFKDMEVTGNDMNSVKIFYPFVQLLDYIHEKEGWDTIEVILYLAGQNIISFIKSKENKHPKVK